MITSDGRRIDYAPEPDLPPDTFRHLLLDQVLPLALSRHEGLVLHAGAVVVRGGAWLFLGGSGSGKSTLVAAVGSRADSRFHSDDYVRVVRRGRRLLAIPSYPGLRLWEDMADVLVGRRARLPAVAHYTDKRRIAPDQLKALFSKGAAVIRKVLVLAPPTRAPAGRIRLRRMSPLESMQALIENAFVLDLANSEKWRRVLDLMGRLAGASPFFRLSHPRDAALLRNVVRALARPR